MTANERYLKDILARDSYIARFSREELLKVLPILEAAHDEVMGKIAKTGGQWTREWLEGLAKDLDEIYKAASTRALGVVEDDGKALAKVERDWQLGSLEGGAPGVKFGGVANSTLWAAIQDMPITDGATLPDLFASLAANSRKSVYDAVKTGIIAGDTVDQMIVRVRGRAIKAARWKKDASGKKRYVPGTYEGGVLEDSTTRQARVLVHTADMAISNRARQMVYDENEDLIAGYQRVETMDEVTCIECAADDGHVYAADDPARPDLPQHPACRGAMIPILKSWREMGIDRDELPDGTRASLDGQVPANMTVAERWAGLSPEDQDKAMGPRRAALFRAGVPLTAMVRDGKILPIEEIPR
jgi:predicted DNA-binding ArsR family transcriptional regulator